MTLSDDPWVELRVEDTRWDDLQEMCETALGAVLARLNLRGDYGISVLGCNDRTIANLNSDFRGKAKPTNVLSWPAEERGPYIVGSMPKFPLASNSAEDDVDLELGDIAISYDTCLREADEQGKAFEDHVVHLLVHGILHLLGFDHENDADAELMERIEVETLAKMGIADPYQNTHSLPAQNVG